MRLASILILKIATAVLLFGMACQEEPELRSRPVEDGDELPGYLDEVDQFVPARTEVEISISESSIKIEPDTTSQDSSVRLRTLSRPPMRDDLVDLQSPVGDILEITFYEKNSKNIFSSEIFEKPYKLNQIVDDNIKPKNLKYVVVTSPDTEFEKIRILSRRAISVAPSTALLQSATQVSIELKLSHAIVYAVDVESVSSSIEISNSSTKISNESTGSILSQDGGEQLLVTPSFPTTFQQKIVPSGVPMVTSTEDYGEDDFFGSSLASDGEFLAVGAQRQDYDRNGENALNNAGLIFVYKKDGDSWVQNQILDAGEYRTLEMNLGARDTWDNLMIMTGDYLIVGTNQTGLADLEDPNPNYKIDAIVYKRTDDTYQLHQVIKRPDYSEYGSIVTSIAVSGATLVVGVRGQDSDENGNAHADYQTSGSVYIYNLQNGSWNFTQKLKGRDHQNQINKGDNFGTVAIEGNTLVVGAHHHDWTDANSALHSKAGAVFIFEFDGSEWKKTEILQIDSPQENNKCGGGVGIYGDTLVFGCHTYNVSPSDGGHSGTDEGAVFVFEKNQDKWSQQAKLTLHQYIPDPKWAVSYCGSQTHLQGDKLLVSCPHWTIGTTSAFAAFSRTEGVWEMDQIEIGTEVGRHVGVVRMVGEMMFAAFPRRAVTKKLNHIVWEPGYIEYWQ